MDLETIALIAMGGCLFLWLVVNFIITLHNVRIAKAAGLTVQVQCEKCGTIYEVTGKEATRPAMVKYKKSSRTHISNGAFVNTQNYSHYAKKFHCPCCDKKTYGKVLDIQELQYEGQDSTIKELGKGFLRMVIGCTIILILAQIPLQIGKKQREREVQQMKEQQYEDLVAQTSAVEDSNDEIRRYLDEDADMDEYIEDMARSKLDFAKPDERVYYVVPDSGRSRKTSEAENN